MYKEALSAIMMIYNAVLEHKSRVISTEGRDLEYKIPHCARKDKACT